MKKVFYLIVFTCFAQYSIAQTEKPTYQYFNKGKSFWGIGISPVSTDIIGSYTDISITKNRTNLGILVSPIYGKFVQNNLMIGVMGIIGFHSEKYSYPSYSSSSSSAAAVETINVNKSSDFGIAPLVRY